MRSILRCAFMLSVSVSPALAQTSPTDVSVLRNFSVAGWIPAFEVRAIASAPDGARANASADRQLVAGASPFTITVTSGATLCAVGVGSKAPAADENRANVWTLTGEYLGQEAGRHQIRVTTGFTRTWGREAAATTTQTLSLRDGDNVVLDTIAGTPNGPCPVRNLTLDGRVVLQPVDPSVSRARYIADLWLVHIDPSGREQREHLITSVDSSGMPFGFSRLSFPIPVVDARQGNAEAFIQLRGTLRAHARTDGLVDVDVDTTRASLFGMDFPDRVAIRATGSTARKTLTLKPEETTAIDFPPPANGYVSLMLDNAGGGVAGGAGARVTTGPPPSGDGPAVEIKDDRLVLYTHRFFNGHRTQMLITLRRSR